MIRKIAYCLIVSLAVFSCKSTSVSTSGDAEKYKEDISKLRPQHEKPVMAEQNLTDEVKEDYSSVQPSHHVTGELDNALNSIDELRKDVNFIDGFTIQVYSGTNSEEARLSRGKVYSILPESNPTMKFEEPNFKVKVGKYYSRIEARRPYAQLKKKFPNAIIIPERIYIR